MTDPSHAFLDFPAPIAFAHRGGGKEADENTIEAFEYAVGVGFQYIETDVRTTSDGVLVTFHDDNLSRIYPDHKVSISALSWNDLVKIGENAKRRIPALSELLGNWPQLNVNIDVKEPRAVDALAKVVSDTNAKDRICVGSFSGKRLRAARHAIPGACTSLAPLDIGKVIATGLIGTKVSTNGQAIQVPHRFHAIPVTTQRFVDHCHANNLKVHVWTIDDESEMRELLDLGVDGIMTDRPSVLKRVLTERGQWIDS